MPGTPATLSSPIIDGVLRRELGYDGVVVTDCLTMKAVASKGTKPEVHFKAFMAGNDILLDSRATVPELRQVVHETLPCLPFSIYTNFVLTFFSQASARHPPRKGTGRPPSGDTAR